MGIFDRFRAKDSPPASSSGAELPSDGLLPAQPSQAPVPELLDVPSLGSGSDQGGAASSSGRFYNPYEGLNTAVDGRSLKAAYKLPAQPEFLFSEEATVHRRSWSENLTYYTGSGYITGSPVCGVTALVFASKHAYFVLLGKHLQHGLSLQAPLHSRCGLWKRVLTCVLKARKKTLLVSVQEH